MQVFRASTPSNTSAHSLRQALKKAKIRSQCGGRRRHGVMEVEFLYNQMNVHTNVYMHISLTLFRMVGLLPCQRRLAEEAHWERNDRRGNHYNRCRSTVTQIVLSVSVLCDPTAVGSTRCGRKPPPLPTSMNVCRNTLRAMRYCYPGFIL